MINDHLRKYTIALQFGFQVEIWIWNQSQRIVVHLTRVYRGRLVLHIKFDSDTENPVAHPIYGIQESGGRTSDTASDNSEYPESLPDLEPISID